MFNSIFTKIIVLFILNIVFTAIAILLPDNIFLKLVLSVMVQIIFFGLILFLLNPLHQLHSLAKMILSGHISKFPENLTDEFLVYAKAVNSLTHTLSNTSTKMQADQKNIESGSKNLIDILDLEDVAILALKNSKIIIVNQLASDLTGYSKSELMNQQINDSLKFISPQGDTIDIMQLSSTNTDPLKINPYSSINLIGKNGNSAEVKAKIIQNPDFHSGIDTLIIIEDDSKEKSLTNMQIDFVSMASHELRTPITSIIGYLSVYMDENKANLNPEQTQFLDRAFISAKQLSALVDNLLNVSKIERNALSVNIKKADWNSIIIKCVEDNKMQATQKNITLFHTLKDTDIQVMADPVRISEVLNNLISNAINYTPAGGKIQVATVISGSQVITAVADTGVGMSSDAIAHLFTKFFRVQGALDKASNSKGTGLGLYLSKSIVELHHGRIWVDSTPNKGTTFYFSLPLYVDNSPALKLPTLN